MKNTLPKEYILEIPAYYDAVRVQSQINSLVDHYGMLNLSDVRYPFVGIAKTQEHKEILHDIFRYVIDTSEYNMFEKSNSYIFIRDFMAALYESGFFG